MTEDLPEELAAVPSSFNMSKVIARVFGGAELIGYHPDKALIAVWYGGTGFNVYNPNAWPLDPNNNVDTGEVYHFNTTDPSRLSDPEENARQTLEDYGFEVVGQ